MGKYFLEDDLVCSAWQKNGSPIVSVTETLALRARHRNIAARMEAIDAEIVASKAPAASPASKRESTARQVALGKEYDVNVVVFGRHGVTRAEYAMTFDVENANGPICVRDAMARRAASRETAT
jgi:hypothetical protein